MIDVNLNGPQGNVFTLMGTAQQLAKQMDLDAEAIVNEMKSGTYENAVAVFKREFKYVVNIIEVEDE